MPGGRLHERPRVRGHGGAMLERIDAFVQRETQP
jgi:hypothetical protein